MKPNLTNPGKVVITIATTGGLHGKDSNPALPEQPKDIIQNFRDCYNAGATVAHMHVRDKRGVTTADLDVYGEVIEGVMSHCPGMITQVGNGIGLHYKNPKAEGEPFTLEERMNLLNIRPQPDQLPRPARDLQYLRSRHRSSGRHGPLQDLQRPRPFLLVPPATFLLARVHYGAT